MTVDEIIIKNIEYLISEIDSPKLKPYLKTAMVSHLKLMMPNIPPDTIKYVLDNWYENI